MFNYNHIGKKELEVKNLINNKTNKNKQWLQINNIRKYLYY